MASPVAILNRGFHRTVDTVLRVDRSQALNDAREPPPEGGPGIAADMRMAVGTMAADAIDGTTGSVDYERIASGGPYEMFRRCTTALAVFDPASLASRNERLAFWINTYNALVLDAVITFHVDTSVRDDNGFFRRAAYTIGGHRYSADDIEHGVLRGNRAHPFPVIPFPQFAPGDPRLAYSFDPVDPRIHFALNCASRSCPPVAAYDADRLDQQLDLAASAFIGGGGVTIDPHRGKVALSRIFRWYQRDFGGRHGVLRFIGRYVEGDELRAVLVGGSSTLVYQPYDWSINRAAR